MTSVKAKDTHTYKFLPLSIVDKYVDEMKKQGVSVVARSKFGFLATYRRADGNPKNLPSHWIAKRNAFIKRHMAQATKNREPLGSRLNPSRRHLALIAWAYSPNSR